MAHRTERVTLLIAIATRARGAGLTYRTIGQCLGVSRERAVSLARYAGQRTGGPKPRYARASAAGASDGN